MGIARPTAGGTLFLLLAGAAIGSALMNVGLMTALCGSILSALLLASFLMAQFSLRGIRVERPAAADVPGGGPAALPLKITNTSFFYRQPLVIREKFDFYLKKQFNAVTPALAPRQSFLLLRQVPAERRGHFALEKVTVISGDPCGLFRRSRKFLLPGEITVTPKITPLAALALCRSRASLHSGEGRLLGRPGIGGDFFGVRPYRAGDEIRHIDWRGSAMRNKLMVKEFEASVTDRIHLILDTDKKAVGQDEVFSNFEALVSAAASITDSLSRRYCQLNFVTFFHSRLCINGDAAGIRLRIMEALTEIVPGQSSAEELFSGISEHIRPGDTVFLLTMSWSEGTELLVRQLNDTGTLVHWLCAPAAGFPPVEPDSPRRLSAKLPEFPGEAAPYILTFRSDLAEILCCDELAEKI